jgi:hypothetical protein
LVNLIGFAALAAAGWFGGWEWMLPCVPLLIALWRTGSSAADVWEAVDPGIVWLVLYALTGERQLFFPYSIQYAAQMACLLRGTGPGAAFAGGAGITAVFLAVRVRQQATGAVLLVELMVATVILLLALWANGDQLRSARRRSVISAGASLAALLALLVL